jgi:hypothetical protein
MRNSALVAALIGATSATSYPLIKNDLTVDDYKRQVNHLPNKYQDLIGG